MLFLSLWNTVDYERDKDDSDSESEDDKLAKPDGNAEIDWAENAHGILNTEWTDEKQEGFDWIDEGFE
jgi:hypothetical protein